jgi:hypothetical protein
MKLLYKPSSDWHKRDDMTIGKIYRGDYPNRPVYSSDGIYYLVTNDWGKQIEVHQNHLIQLDKLREGKLKELGI